MDKEISSAFKIGKGSKRKLSKPLPIDKLLSNRSRTQGMFMSVGIRTYAHTYPTKIKFTTSQYVIMTNIFKHEKISHYI